MNAERVVAAVALLACAEAALAHEAALSRYTYWQHVRPIFEKHCAGCHREGGVGPMSLLEYQSVVPWSNAIKLELLSRAMPPYLPEETDGPFRGARTLTAEEIDILIDWTVGATPEGEPFEAPRPAGESRAEPDVLVDAAADVVIDADAYDETVCIRFPGFSGPRVLSRASVHSLTPAVLKRATLYGGDSCSSGEPVLTWLGDEREASFPEGLGFGLAPGENLALELRYVKGWNDEGVRIVDRPKLGLSFASRDDAVETRRVESSGRLAEGPVALVALYPDASTSPGEEPLRVEAVEPDGTIRQLLEIRNFDPAWREKYFFEKPKSFPAGTLLRVSRPTVWVDFTSKSSP